MLSEIIHGEFYFFLYMLSIVKLFKAQMGWIKSSFKLAGTLFVLFYTTKQVVTSNYLNTAVLSYAYATNQKNITH